MSGEEDRPMLPCMLSGRVTQVVDPHNFWMQLWTPDSLHHFEQLQQNLDQFCEQNFVPVSDLDTLQEGEMVLVECNPAEQPRWRRGIITRLMTRQDSVDVIFIDYGYTEMTSRDHLCAEFPRAFKGLPQQAVRCTLAGVVPISKSWTSRGTKTFQNLTSSKTFHVLVVHYDVKYHYYKVSLYLGNEDNGQSVSHCLLEEEVAMSNNDEVIPEFIRDVPAFIAGGLPGSSPPSSNSDKSDKTETSSPTKSTFTNCDKSPPPSAEKYIPPHVKNPGATSGALPPGYEKQQPPNSGFTKQSVQQSYGATSGAFPPGYEKQQPPNSGYAKQSVQQGYSKHGQESAYVKQSSETDKHGGVRQQTTPPRSYNHHGNHLRTPNKTQLSPAIEIKEKIANDFFPFDNVSVYPPSPVSPTKSPDKASLPSNRHGQGSYFSRSPPGSNNNRGHYKPPADENERQWNEKKERRIDTYCKGKPENRSNFPQVPPVSHTFEPGFMANKSNSATVPSPYRSSVKSDARDPTPSPQGRPRLDIEAASGNVPPFYPQRPPRMHHHHHNAAMESLPSVTKPELLPPGYYQSHANPPPINYLPPAPLSQVFDSPPQVSTVNFSSHPSRSPNVPLVRNSPRNERYSDPYYNRNTNCDTTDAKYSSPKNDLDINPTRDSSNSFPNSGQNKSYNSTLLTKYGRQDGNKWSPTTPDDEVIESFNFSEFDHTQTLSKDHLNERLQREKMLALQEEAAKVERESQEQAMLVELARFGTRSGNSNFEDQYVDLEVVSSPQISADTDYTINYEPKELEYVRYTSRKSPPHDTAQTLPGVPRHLAEIDFSMAVKEVFRFTKQNGEVENMKALLDDVFESLTKGCSEKQLCDVMQVLLSSAIRDYDMFHPVVLEAITSLNAKMEVQESLLQALKEQHGLCIRKKKHGPLHVNCARVTGHVYVAAGLWGESGASVQDGILHIVERWILFNVKGQGQMDQDDLYTECMIAFFEVAGISVCRDRAFCTRIKEDLMLKILNENVSRNVRECLFKDIFLSLFTREMESHDAMTQTPRKTMIPSSCQVKPSTRDQESSTALDWQNDDYFTVNPDTVATTTAPSAQSDNIVGRTVVSSTPEPNISLRPRGRGRKSKPISMETASVGVERSGSPHTYANISLNSSVQSNPSDSVYFTPNEGEANKTSDKPFSGVHNLMASFKEQAYNDADVDDQSSGSEKGSTHSATNSNKSNNSSVNGNEAAKHSLKEPESPQKNQQRSIVDWFDYESQPGYSTKTVEEKKLKTKIKLETATMNIIQNEMDKKSVAFKPEQKSKNKKEKRKVRTASEEDTIETDKSQSDAKESVIEVEKANIAGNDEEGTTEVTQEEDWDAGFRNENFTRMTENSEKVKSREGMEVGATGNVAGTEDSKDIDWWSDVEPQGLGVIQGVTSSCGIFTDNGPDVIIEDEFEQDIAGTQEDFDLNDLRAEAEKSAPLCDEINDAGDASSIMFDSKSVTTNFGAGPETVASYNEDEFAFHVQNEWHSDVDDFELNGKPDPEYEAQFPSSDLHSVIRNPSPYSAPSIGFGANVGRTHQVAPSGTLAEYLPTVEVQNEAPVRPRWVPGARRCFSCHQTDHTTDVCPNKPSVLS